MWSLFFCNIYNKKMKLYPIFESLGVPDNIHNVSDLIIDEFLSLASQLNHHNDIKFTFKKSIKINNIQINLFDVEANLRAIPSENLVDNTSDVYFLTGAFQTGKIEPIGTIKNKPTFIKRISISENTVNLGFSFGYQFSKLDIMMGKKPDYLLSWSELARFLKNNYHLREHVGTIISHELMHYTNQEYVKSHGTNPDELAKYQSIDRVLNDNAISKTAPLQNFFFLKYYLTQTENIVRPAELDYKIQKNKMGVEDFKKLLKNDEAVTQIRNAKYFTYEKLIKDLRNSGILEDILEADKIKFAKINIDDTEKLLKFILNRAMQIYFTNYTSILVNLFSGNDKNVRDYILNNEKHPDSVIDKKFQKYWNYVKKYASNYEMFYRDEIKNLNQIGDKMLKKIGALYGRLPQK